MQLPELLQESLAKRGITEFRPAQQKAIDAGLLDGKNLIICTPTASGKTLIAELAMLSRITLGKAIYIVPLKALAAEKFRDFKNHYGDKIKVAVASGDLDSADGYLASYDLIIVTSEKLDSLIRHGAPWLSSIKTVVIDEIHLLHDQSRGPTLEVVITILKRYKVQFLGLSATIGNPELLAEWLDAGLVVDTWRPVELQRGIYNNGKITFS